jgi:hypothetical protein
MKYPIRSHAFRAAALSLYGLTSLWAAWLALSGHPWALVLLAVCWIPLAFFRAGRLGQRSVRSPHTDRQTSREGFAELAGSRKG